jgi:hypothetical protein
VFAKSLLKGTQFVLDDIQVLMSSALSDISKGQAVTEATFSIAAFQLPMVEEKLVVNVKQGSPISHVGFSDLPTVIPTLTLGHVKKTAMVLILNSDVTQGSEVTLPIMESMMAKTLTNNKKTRVKTEPNIKVNQLSTKKHKKGPKKTTVPGALASTSPPSIPLSSDYGMEKKRKTMDSKTVIDQGTLISPLSSDYDPEIFDSTFPLSPDFEFFADEAVGLSENIEWLPCDEVPTEDMLSRFQIGAVFIEERGNQEVIIQGKPFKDEQDALWKVVVKRRVGDAARFCEPISLLRALM